MILHNCLLAFPKNVLRKSNKFYLYKRIKYEFFNLKNNKLLYNFDLSNLLEPIKYEWIIQLQFISKINKIQFLLILNMHYLSYNFILFLNLIKFTLHIFISKYILFYSLLFLNFLFVCFIL